MKMLLSRVCCIALCITSLFLLASCQQETDKNNETSEPPVKVEQWSETLIKSDPDGVEYDYYFANVKDLLAAIKHSPDKYNNAKIKVIGTTQKGNEGLLYETRLVDYTMRSDDIPSTSSFSGHNAFRRTLDSSTSKIDIVITNDAQFSVVEDGDYVKLYGFVRLTRDSVYLGNCEYDLIATLDERIQNVK